MRKHLKRIDERTVTSLIDMWLSAMNVINNYVLSDTNVFACHISLYTRD